MSIIIRLQHLPVTAKSTDIRKYFFGLRIPEGGVHIVGGLTGDAFIAFATDEDARQAILLNHGLIHNNRINLLLSSKTEMNAVIASAKKAEANNKSITSHQQQYLSSSPPSKRICPSTFESNNRSSIYPTASDQQSSISLPTVPASSGRSSNDSWMRNESWKTDQTRDNPARYNNYATRTTPPPSSWNNDRSSSSQCPSTTTIDRAYPIMHAAPDLQHYPSSSFDPTVMQQHNDKAINQSTMIIDSVHHHAPIGRRHRPSLLPEPISTTLPPAPIVGPAYSNDSCCIELRRLPVDLLRPIALEQFLRPSVPLTLSSIKAVFDPQGFHLYSMVRFANVNDANDAIARDGEQGIRIRQCTISDFDRQPHSLIPASVAAAAAAPHKSSSVSSAPSLAINERYCLELSNVPIRADEHDILNFLGIVPMKMFKTCNRQDDSRWIVQFDSLTKAEQIAQMQRDIAGNRIYIARITNETADRQEIEIANRKHDNIPTQIVADDQKNKKEEEEEKKDRVVQLADESRVVGFFNRSSTNDLSSFDRTPPVDPYHSTATKDNHHHQDSTESIARHNKLQSNQSESSSCYLRLTNVPANVSDRDVIRFLDANVVNNGVHNMHNGSVYVQVCSDIDSYRAIRHNRSYLGANCILISAITQEAFNASIRGSTIIDPEVVQSIGKPGSVIAVRGLPADVTLDDLITFFDRYQLVQDSVRMHFDDNGTPSGDCLLALSSCTEANKAVQSLNGRRLRRSVVTLSIVEI